MNGKIILMVLDQRAALLKLVQGPTKSNPSPVKVKKSEPVVVKPRISNEVQSRTPDGVDLDGDGQLDSEGCMKKIVMVEEVEFDTEIKCQHVSQESCFESYMTTFKKTKTEECDESFKKECEIEYHKVPKEEKVEICNEMLTRDCGVDGPEVCSKEYETVCETVYEEHAVEEMVPDCTTTIENLCMIDDAGEEWCDNVPKRECEIVTKPSVKLTPKTECRKEVAQVCGPETCPIVKGDRICKDEIKTVIHEVPQESCTMVPRKVCNIVSKVVPTLEPVKHCIDIPKEMCAKSRINPVRKSRPVVRKWCLSDNKEDDGIVDTVYVVSSLNDVQAGSGNDATLEAYLVDANTGERIEGCRTEFSPFNYGPFTQDGLTFGIVGQQRELVACGSQDGTCFSHDFASGDVDSSDSSVSNGPKPLAASFVDGAASSWMILGGITIPTGGGDPELDAVLRAASTSSSFSELAFDSTDASESFPGLDLGGSSCLLKFGSSGDAVTFVATTKEGSPEETVYYIKRGDGEVRTNADNPITGKGLGFQPICGYSVVTDEDNDIDANVGDTAVYFLIQATSSDPVQAYMMLVPTGTEDGMSSYFSADGRSGGEEEFGFLEGVARPTQGGTAGQYSRAASTIWLGDNRSLVVPSYKDSMIQFDANTFQFSYLVEPDTDTLEDSKGILFTCRATQKDRERMGCA